MKKFLIVPLVAVILSACQTPEKKPAETVAMAHYTVPDDAAITKAVHDAYAAISFKKARSQGWMRYTTILSRKRS